MRKQLLLFGVLAILFIMIVYLFYVLSGEKITIDHPNRINQSIQSIEFSQDPIVAVQQLTKMLHKVDQSFTNQWPHVHYRISKSKVADVEKQYEKVSSWTITNISSAYHALVLHCIFRDKHKITFQWKYQDDKKFKDVLHQHLQFLWVLSKTRHP